MKALAAAALLAGLAPGAAADDIAGAWSFETRIKAKGCVITGNMKISPADANGLRTCQFISTETCDWQGEEAAATVDQSCRIIPQGGFYLFSSKVEQTLTPTGAYLADHFTVKPDGPDRMVGQWHDRLYRDAVVFRRDRNAAIS